MEGTSRAESCCTYACHCINCWRVYCIARPVERMCILFLLPTMVVFLGIFIDSNLSFKYYTSTIRKKLSKALYNTLRIARNILSSKNLKLIYYSTFHCHLIYAIQIWSCCPTANINELCKLQKTAVRILCNAKYNPHTEPLF